MVTARLILSDQLSRTISSLKHANKDDLIVFYETSFDLYKINHHKKKIAFLLASARRFAESLVGEGLNVFYLKCDDQNNTGNFNNDIESIILSHNISKIIVTDPNNWALKEFFVDLSKKYHVTILEDDRFLATSKDFAEFASTRKELRMEYFYRSMRKKYNILMHNNEPIGGKWNYDSENRRAFNNQTQIPKRISHKKSEILKSVLQLVPERFASNFGNLEPFFYATTREEALIELESFVENILVNFGDYQDAMKRNEPYLFHSLISSYLNAGLLLPIEVVKLAEEAYLNGKVALNAAEGFIRQILGWREYIRGIYNYFMPEYKELNYLGATVPLPEFYWTQQTDMFCIKEVVNHTKEHAYSHHIQRLMITGNFALIAGLDVKEVQEWYLAVYSDAFEWVEMPNTLGMALFGDGGIVASKPYAASAKYINKMSDYCKSCKYNPLETVEEGACPFNYLYWAFLNKHRAKFEKNQRMKIMYNIWDKFSSDKKNIIIKKAKYFISNNFSD
ncbi:MAG: cryptochrome/photolyase family protein [Rickettsiaceae bacterium]|nr:cryptochrome/photolyase family protein [Rickettsiaceae bacterium]